MRPALFALILAPFPALADCPPAPDVSEATTAILEQVRGAATEMEARALFNGVWELWTQAPDGPAQELLDRGMEARNAYDFIAALDAFDRLTEYCPEYAEGFNQRAFVNFLRADYEAALPDLEAALALRPDHVAALSGKALTLIGLGRADEAQIVLRQALALNPWLPERHLLKEPAGKDL